MTDDATRPQPERGRTFLDALDRYRARLRGGPVADSPPSIEVAEPATPTRLALEFRAAWAQRRAYAERNGKVWGFRAVAYGDVVGGVAVLRTTLCAGCRNPLGGTKEPRERGDRVYHPRCELSVRRGHPGVTLLVAEREERARRAAVPGSGAR